MRLFLQFILELALSPTLHQKTIIAFFFFFLVLFFPNKSKTHSRKKWRQLAHVWMTLSRLPLYKPQQAQLVNHLLYSHSNVLQGGESTRFRAGWSRGGGDGRADNGTPCERYYVEIPSGPGAFGNGGCIKPGHCRRACRSGNNWELEHDAFTTLTFVVRVLLWAFVSVVFVQPAEERETSGGFAVAVPSGRCRAWWLWFLSCRRAGLINCCFRWVCDFMS